MSGFTPGHRLSRLARRFRLLIRLAAGRFLLLRTVWLLLLLRFALLRVDPAPALLWEAVPAGAARP